MYPKSSQLATSRYKIMSQYWLRLYYSLELFEQSRSHPEPAVSFSVYMRERRKHLPTLHANIVPIVVNVKKLYLAYGSNVSPHLRLDTSIPQEISVVAINERQLENHCLVNGPNFQSCRRKAQFLTTKQRFPRLMERVFLWRSTATSKVTASSRSISTNLNWHVLAVSITCSYNRFTYSTIYLCV